MYCTYLAPIFFKVSQGWEVSKSNLDLSLIEYFDMLWNDSTNKLSGLYFWGHGAHHFLKQKITYLDNSGCLLINTHNCIQTDYTMLAKHFFPFQNPTLN